MKKVKCVIIFDTKKQKEFTICMNYDELTDDWIHFSAAYTYSKIIKIFTGYWNGITLYTLGELRQKKLERILNDVDDKENNEEKKIIK